jgi:hypothetical protein
MQYYEYEMKLFWNFIKKRHTVYKEKEINGQSPPWTDDPILLNYKFTNVCRQLDRGTMFVTNYIYRKIPRGSTNAEVIFNVILYRLFNLVETYLGHGFIKFQDYETHEFIETLNRLNQEQRTVFTSAFIVSGYSMTELAGMTKIERCGHILQWMIDQLNDDPTIVKDIMSDTTMEATYKALLKICGLGPFLAYQIAVDLSYWKKTKFGEDDFVVMGPGAKRGIDRLFPDDPEARDGKNYEECCFWLRDRQYEFYEDYGIDCKTLFDDMQFPYLTVMTFENLCCEFSKYMKAVYDEGRPRNKYNPQEGYERKAVYKKKEKWNQKPYNVFSKGQNLTNLERILVDG